MSKGKKGRVTNQDNFNQIGATTKKKFPIWVIGIVVVVIIAALIVVKSINAKKSAEAEAQRQAQLTASMSDLTPVYTRLEDALHGFTADIKQGTDESAYAIDDCVGAKHGDSYLAQEWAYVNRVQLREELIALICSVVDITPLDNTGKAKVVVPDYSQFLIGIDADTEEIKDLYKASKYQPTDGDYEEKMYNLYCQYIVDKYTKEPIPTMEVEVDFGATTNEEGYAIFSNDAELDNYLFATDDLHECEKHFSQLALDFQDTRIEYYDEKETIHNDEFDAWLQIFLKYYEEDGGSYDPATNTFSGGHFDPKTSKWEPWYLRDDNNQMVYDENGEKVVNYYTVKDENGDDWVQPDEVVTVNVQKSREVSNDWIDETGVPYAMSGTYYISHDYTGKYPTAFKVGDGSIGFPAGIGTPIITKAKDVNGNYVDVRVTLLGYWTGQDAIDYAESFSAQNRGFTLSSPVKLLCCELRVENVSEEPISFRSEMTLCDKNANISNKTGTLYGFTDIVTLNPGEEKIINDWVSSTDIDLKYLCWGNSFGRTYPTIYFDALAATGEVPSYSAYEQFTGDPLIIQGYNDEATLENQD